MKPCYKLLFLSCFLSYGLSAQPKLKADNETDSHQGEIWLSGIYNSLNEDLAIGVGYFLSEDLLIGSYIESLSLPADGYQLSLSPFVRYYASEVSNGWRPYAQVGANWIFNGGFDSFNNYGGGVGVEKKIQASTLLNINLDYTKTPSFSSDDWGLSVRLNTTLSGLAGRTAAMAHFQKGTFLLNGQLFNTELSNNKLADGFTFDITPHAYYFLSERLAIEGSLGLIWRAYNQKISSIEKDITQQELNLVVGLRYYITNQSLFNLFGGGAFSYDYGHRSVDGNSNTLSEIAAVYELGNSLFINRSTSFDLGINATQGFESGTSGLSWDLLGRLNFWFR
jgi:hypothetical protein